MYAHFSVGNPTDARATVELRIRPVDVPVDWSYRLSDGAPVLDPGETAKVFLEMDPNGSMLRGRVVRFGVEGYINDRLHWEAFTLNAGSRNLTTIFICLS